MALVLCKKYAISIDDTHHDTYQYIKKTYHTSENILLRDETEKKCQLSAKK